MIIKKQAPHHCGACSKYMIQTIQNVGLPLEFQIFETVNCQLKNIAAGFPLGDHLRRAFGAEAFLFADAVGVVAGEDFWQQGQQVLGAAL